MSFWIVAHNVISPLGSTSGENYTAIHDGKTAIKNIGAGQIGSAIQKELLPAFSYKKNIPLGYTFFEELLIRSVTNALSFSSISPTSDRVVFILSTTKGNIGLLENEYNKEQLLLSYSANAVATYFGNPNKPVVISNACISGVMALIVAKRLIASNQYDHAIVVGADVLSNFVWAGFQSLKAIGQVACKPFDKNRMGISLGEAAATVIVSSDKEAGEVSAVRIVGGGLSNDANHISGPSKTGAELAIAIDQALKESNMNADAVDFISAHGTATLYNDEMEAKAFDLAGLIQKPVNSLKGSVGHTLGAAGLVESVMNIQGLLNNEVLPTVGFEIIGVSKPLKVSSQLNTIETRTCLKTGSGFGGCNAAILFKKE